MEEWENLPWKPFPSRLWNKFKNKMIEKYLNPVPLSSETYTEADKKYEKFMRQKKLMKELLEKLGENVDYWTIEEDLKRKAGFRAQKWFSEMLFDLRVRHGSELKTFGLSEHFFQADLKQIGLDINDWKTLYYKLGIGPDIRIEWFGTVEIKSIKPDSDIYNVKKVPWDSQPSIYLVVLRICDEEMLTFQFMGWLYGFEIYELKVQPSNNLLYPVEHYYGNVKELRSPKTFLEKLLKISRANPKG